MPRLAFPSAAGLLAALALAAPSPAAAGSPAATSAQAATPKPAVPVATFAKRLERALTTRGCPGLKSLNRLNQIRIPCPFTSKKLKAAFKDFRVTGTKTYGSGAVIDFKDGEAPRGGTYVLLLSENRTWSIVFAPVTNRRTSATKAGDLSGHQGAVNGFLPAVRDGDCKAYFRFAATPPGQDEQEACTAAFGANGLYTGLQADLRANPATTGAPLGGNRTFAFFAIRTGATYRTAATLRTPRAANVPYLVITTERV